MNSAEVREVGCLSYGRSATSPAAARSPTSPCTNRLPVHPRRARRRRDVSRAAARHLHRPGGRRCRAHRTASTRRRHRRPHRRCAGTKLRARLDPQGRQRRLRQAHRGRATRRARRRNERRAGRRRGSCRTPGRRARGRTHQHAARNDLRLPGPSTAGSKTPSATSPAPDLRKTVGYQPPTAARPLGLPSRRRRTLAARRAGTRRVQARPLLPRDSKLAPIGQFIDILSIDVYGDPDPAVVDQLRQEGAMLGTGTVRVQRLHAGFARVPLA